MPSPNLSEHAYQILLNRMVSCQDAPGTLLNEERLVQELGISRTPIRTALIRLQQEHLVQIKPKKGILVTPITPDDIRDLFDLRELIEPYALREFGDHFEKRELLEYLKHFSRPCAPEAYKEVFDCDIAFHTQIVTLTANTYLCAYYRSLQNLFSRIMRICGTYVNHRVGESNDEHVEILTALLQDDAKHASELLLLHLKRARQSAYETILSGVRDGGTEQTL